MKKAQQLKKEKPFPLIQANRRREWRLDLPLATSIHGNLPDGKKFEETTTIENISATGAYFCLDSGLVVGSKLNLMIDLPRQLTGGKNIKLNLGGITVRLEEPNKRAKRQGVAIRFEKDFKFIEVSKKKKPK
ncbi:MAG: PilZ domain-containing protein [Clostridiales bacterium]|jgi:c-di-GMP-binding flagellar brake protein YcgR|nr:PilZ domain-containing protein [Clostridiales bacterium]